MARKQSKRKKTDDEFIKVDAYLIPKQQAEMYRVLREAVAEDVMIYLKDKYARVDRITEEADEGEALVAYDVDDKQKVQYLLNPMNISQAQKARDKDQLQTYLDHFIESEKLNHQA